MISYFHGFYFSGSQISLAFPVFISIFQCQNFVIFSVFWVKFDFLFIQLFQSDKIPRLFPDWKMVLFPSFPVLTCCLTLTTICSPSSVVNLINSPILSLLAWCSRNISSALVSSCGNSDLEYSVSVFAIRLSN